MSDNYTISTQKPADKAFDYDELRSAGISYVEDTASAQWTDYNIHDPGITALELLCYAVTDLSYRSNYSIPDLMRKKSDNPSDIIKEFLTAKQIFPNRALTINDYRKLIIDVEGIKNAWLKKKTKSLVADLTLQKLVPVAPAGSKTKDVFMKGYYDVLLEFDNTVSKEAEKKNIIDGVRVLLNQNRNLDEDFVKIQTVDQQFFRLCSEIELSPDTDSIAVLADIFFGIQLHLTPLVKFYSLQQMLEDKNENFTTDKIFEGPFIPHGFIKESELQDSELKKEIHLSDLMQLMLNIDGVLNIPDILFNDITQAEELENKWVIPVKDGFQARVDILSSNIVLYKNGVPFRPGANDKAKIIAKFNQKMEEYLAANESVRSTDLGFDTGSFRDPSGYYSVQNHFPKTYGISHWGLPEDATVERKKQAKQFQAYLWLYDQVLANYLAQLSSVKNIFSVGEEKHTLFTQLVNTFRDAGKLFVNYVEVIGIDGHIDEEASWKNCIPAIQEAAEKGMEADGDPNEDKAFYNRRNRFLDHLLSRFAESFYDYVGILHSLFPYTRQKEIVDAKRNFLPGYPLYSSQRSMAFDYTDKAELWDTQNISGFEKRVKSLLGIENIRRRSLVNLYYVIREELAGAVKKFWFEVMDNRSDTVLLIQSEKAEVTVLPPAQADQQKEAEKTAREKVEEELQVAYALCMLENSLAIIKDADGKFLYELRDKTNTLVATGTEGTKKNAGENLDLLKKYLAGMSDEGMFLVEHLLLYNEKINTFMPICVDSNCDDCTDTDPYSFRISMVLPAYAKRFINMDFRQYVERVLREEMPAHLVPKICWVSNEQLKEFEDVYHDWLKVKAGVVEDPGGAILAKFIDVLVHLKSIYPKGLLTECDDETKNQLFILDKNSLGTQ